MPEPLAPTIRIRPRRSMIMSFSTSGMPSAFELRQLGRDEAQHHRDVAALVEHVDAETAEPGFRDREIDLEIARELLELLSRS